MYATHTSWKVTTAPTEEPVSIQEAREHLRVSTDEEDPLIQGLITAARQTVENITRRALCTQTITMKLDALPYPAGCIELPVAPLVSVTSIAYVDSAGSSQTWSSSNYTADTSSEPPRIVPVYAGYWPSTRGHINDATIVFVAGYGGAGVVPEGIKQAMKLLISHYFENREAAVIEQGAGAIMLPFGVDALLTPFRWEVR